MKIDWKELAAPFPASEVKHKPGRKSKATGRTSGPLAYITARQVMNRLDKVVGPPNWCSEFEETERGVVCTLFIRVDDEWIGKADIGSESDIEGDKGAYSDAFKRAGVSWGIGRELYQDGTAFDDDAPASAPNKRSVKQSNPQPIPGKARDNGPTPPHQRPDLVARFAQQYTISDAAAANGLKRHLEDGTITAAMSDDDVVRAIVAANEARDAKKAG